MESENSLQLMEKNFVFFKRLPMELYTHGDYETYIVSPGDSNTADSIRNQLKDSTVKYYSSPGQIKITRENKTFVLILANENPVFAYLNNYAFLGTILATVLKYSLSPELYINKNYLGIERRGYTHASHNVVIGDNWITKDFSSILKLFELSPTRLIAGFNTREDFWKYLAESPFIYHDSVQEFENTKEDLNEFYQFIKRQPLRLKRKFNRNDFYKLGFDIDRYDKKCNDNLTIWKTVYDKFNLTAMESVVNDLINDKATLGKLMSKFRESFLNKTEFKAYIFQIEDKVLHDKFRSFIQQNL